MQVEPGDTIVLYTDGVTEAMNGDGEQYGVDRIQEVFRANPPTDSEQATHALFDGVREFVGDTPQSDDITCFLFRRPEDGSQARSRRKNAGHRWRDEELSPMIALW